MLNVFSFHGAAGSTREVRLDVLVVRLSGGGVRVATTDKEHVWSGEQLLDMEVSGVKRSFVMCDLSPTPKRAMSIDMARDFWSTARRLRDRRLRVVL